MVGERVLVIEQTPEVRQFLVDDIFRPAGFEVLAGESGQHGIALAHELEPDLIIAGNELPDQSGLALLSTFRAGGETAPFILAVQSGSEDLAVRALRAGADDYIRIPCSADEVLVVADRVMRKHRIRAITDTVPDRLLRTNRMLEQRLHGLNTLVQIGQRVTSELDLKYVLAQVVEAAVRLSEAEEGTLLLVDDESGELYLYASSNNPAVVDGTFRLPVSDSLAGHVVQTGQALVVSGAELQKIKTHYFFLALAYVPLRLKEKVIGVLGVSNRDKTGSFGGPTLEMLQVLADFSASAIDNAQLFAASEMERQTLDAVLRSTGDAIIIVDPQQNVMFCNSSACNVFQVDYSAIKGLALRQAFDNEYLLDLFDHDTRIGESRAGEVVVDDGRTTLNAHLTVVDSVGTVVVMQDITHLKELDRIKSEFVTTVSHDLRSPLTAILGYIELLSRTGSLNENQQEYVGRIVFSVQSITALLSDLMELGKIEAGFDLDRELVALSMIVQDAIEGQRHHWESKQHTLEIHLDENLLPVLGNPQRLRQLVNNLLENAIKYTPDNGTITIALVAESDFLLLSVADTGIGIPQEDQPYIFDKFYRTDEAIDDYEGTGLGLSIVKGIVDQHDGRIWVDSRLDQGTTFTVMLPSHHAG